MKKEEIKKESVLRLMIIQHRKSSCLMLCSFGCDILRASSEMPPGNLKEESVYGFTQYLGFLGLLPCSDQKNGIVV